jgi:2-oxoglutarate ferredoxin oxidoreductase subunit beta
MATEVKISDYLREREFPTIWCPGCGHGIILMAAIRAIAKLGLKKDDILAVSGIGCSARSPAYLDFNGIQTTHGRAIAFATGMKLHRPDMRALLFLGDGDCAAIGGNHFLHAARRNIDMTVIVMNNYTYGMTGGQVSPTTPYMGISSTTPLGNIEPEMNLCEVAKAAGATFVARTTAYHFNQLATFIERGIKNRGFSFIECLSPCPTGFGRRNKFKNPVEMYQWLRDSTIPVSKAKTMAEEELKGKIVTGIFNDISRPEFVDAYIEQMRQIQETGTAKKDEYIEMVPLPRGFKNPAHCEIRLSGSGGQGLILASVILADAAVRQGMEVAQSQSYGPEARGGASRSELILSSEEINFFQVRCPDILLTMTQQSYDKYAREIKPGGIIVADSTFVKELPAVGAKTYEAPISRIAIDRLGSVLVSNAVALGILARVSRFLLVDTLEKAVCAQVPANLRELNIKALNEGYSYAEQLMK